MRYGKITKDILLTVATVGIIAIAATSPYFLINIAKGVIKYKGYNRKRDNIDEKSLARSLAGLNKNKIIILKKEGGQFTVKLTEKGKKIVKRIQFYDMKIDDPEKWDGKWRIVIFDIPERKGRYGRDAMRQKLQKMGFYQFQKSVWAYPHPCEKEIQLLCEVLGVNPFVNIITAQEIYNDGGLKKHFGL